MATDIYVYVYIYTLLRGCVYPCLETLRLQRCADVKELLNASHRRRRTEFNNLTTKPSLYQQPYRTHPKEMNAI